jgi:glycosyltransferase Alg8
VENGWDVTYVPDAVIYCLESLPGKGFVIDTWNLQKRWFGNMVRGGIKALELGPKTLGWFTYLALIDQKISMWTPLFGVIFFALATVLHDAAFAAMFAVWVMATRTVHTLVVGLISGRWHPIFPLLTYYGQIGGSLIKIFVNHNPNVQKWTRQSTGGDRSALPRADSRLMLGASMLAFVALVVILSNVTADRSRFDLRHSDYYADARQEP